MSLDFSKPYAEVHGLPGAVFEQGGLYFKADGQPAGELREFVEEVIIRDDSVPPPIACYEQSTAPVEAEDGKTMETMHWKHLKALVESFGGEWTNKEDAINFMKGK